MTKSSGSLLLEIFFLPEIIEGTQGKKKKKQEGVYLMRFWTMLTMDLYIITFEMLI